MFYSTNVFTGKIYYFEKYMILIQNIIVNSILLTISSRRLWPSLHAKFHTLSITFTVRWFALSHERGHHRLKTLQKSIIPRGTSNGYGFCVPITNFKPIRNVVIGIFVISVIGCLLRTVQINILEYFVIIGSR